MKRIVEMLRLIANYVNEQISLDELLIGMRKCCDHMEKERNENWR